MLIVGVWFAWRDRRVDFIHHLDPGPDTDAVAELTFDRILPTLVTDGYAMVAQAGNTTIFERRFFPAWTVLVAIFAFPFGLLALLARGRETIVIVTGVSSLELYGCTSKTTADYIVATADYAAAHLATTR